MGFLDKLGSFLRETQQTQANAQEEMKYKTDAELKKIASQGAGSSYSMGRAKAALEELRRRGYNV